ncbi:MAG: hypothetical protein V1888_02380 [archaeon]
MEKELAKKVAEEVFRVRVQHKVPLQEVYLSSGNKAFLERIRYEILNLGIDALPLNGRIFQDVYHVDLDEIKLSPFYF